jgi:hypothetical protein
MIACVYFISGMLVTQWRRARKYGKTTATVKRAREIYLENQL